MTGTRARPEHLRQHAFRLRPASQEDCLFAFEAKNDALGPHVAARWGWDEAVQREYHVTRWSTRPWQVIMLGDEQVGTVSIDLQATHLQFGEFYLRSPHRGRGLGTAVVLHALDIAGQARLDTRLEYLKWNPVASLYARHGFEVIGESETHCYASRAWRASHAG